MVVVVLKVVIGVVKVKAVNNVVENVAIIVEIAILVVENIGTHSLKY